MQPELRDPLELVARGMWMYVAGKSTETWEMLPESQRIWWLNRATNVVTQWVKAVNQGY